MRSMRREKAGFGRTRSTVGRLPFVPKKGGPRAGDGHHGAIRRTRYTDGTGGKPELESFPWSWLDGERCTTRLNGSSALSGG